MEDRRVKPVHIITNQEDFVFLLHSYGIEIVAKSETDYTDSGRRHWHIAALWPITTNQRGNPTLTPHRTTFAAKFRKLYGCIACKHWKGKKRCTFCGLDLKFKWPRTAEHWENIKNYISNPEFAILRGRQQPRTNREESDED